MNNDINYFSIHSKILFTEYKTFTLLLLHFVHTVITFSNALVLEKNFTTYNMSMLLIVK